MLLMDIILLANEFSLTNFILHQMWIALEKDKIHLTSLLPIATCKSIKLLVEFLNPVQLSMLFLFGTYSLWSGKILSFCTLGWGKGIIFNPENQGRSRNYFLVNAQESCCSIALWKKSFAHSQ